MSTTEPKKSRGGRPRSPDPKITKVEVRLTPTEKATLRRIAEARGLTMSELMLTATLGHLRRP